MLDQILSLRGRKRDCHPIGEVLLSDQLVQVRCDLEHVSLHFLLSALEQEAESLHEHRECLRGKLLNPLPQAFYQFGHDLKRELLGIHRPFVVGAELRDCD